MKKFVVPTIWFFVVALTILVAAYFLIPNPFRGGTPEARPEPTPTVEQPSPTPTPTVEPTPVEVAPPAAAPADVVEPEPAPPLADTFAPEPTPIANPAIPAAPPAAPPVLPVPPVEPPVVVEVPIPVPVPVVPELPIPVPVPVPELPVELPPVVEQPTEPEPTYSDFVVDTENGAWAGITLAAESLWASKYECPTPPWAVGHVASDSDLPTPTVGHEYLRYQESPNIWFRYDVTG